MVAQLCLVAMAIVALAGAVSDVRSLTIPNSVSLLIVGLFVPYAIGSAMPWGDAAIAVGVALSVLAVGVGVFAAGLVGGGDAKLLAAVSLWAGPRDIATLLVVTALAGGMLALLLFLPPLARAMRALRSRPRRADPRHRPRFAVRWRRPVARARAAGDHRCQPAPPVGTEDLSRQPAGHGGRAMKLKRTVLVAVAGLTIGTAGARQPDPAIRLPVEPAPGPPAPPTDGAGAAPRRPEARITYPDTAEAHHPGRPGRLTLVHPTETPIVLERGKGVLLQLPGGAASFFVADPAVADIQTPSAAQLYVFGKAPGQTVVYAIDGHGDVLYSAYVEVVPGCAAIRAALHRLVPDERVDVVPVGAAVALTGSVSSPAIADDIVRIAAQFVDKDSQILNRLSVLQPAQVQLRVRIAEVDRNALKQIGINWESVVQSGKFAFAAATQNPVTFSDGLVRNIARLGNGDVTATVDALAQDGLITLLAQPNLTAMSGHTASFLAGGEFPVPVALSQSGTIPSITVEFKKFGVSLDFTPTVLDGGAISLRVRPEVSQLSSTGAVQQQGFSIPAITVRRADTTIELGSGETFVIAGLLQRTSEQALSKVPGLGDIPVLGSLFRSTRYRHGETELVIIVTPYLVRPMANPRDAAMPTDGLVVPNDADRVIGGRLYRRQQPAAPASAPGQEIRP